MRVGLLGFACRTGLGAQNRMIAEHAADTFMVVEHPQLPVKDEVPKETGRVLYDALSGFDQWLADLDWLLVSERFAPPAVEKVARQHRRPHTKVAIIVNHEWIPREGFAADLLIAPTKLTHEILQEHNWPCEYVPMGVDTRRFVFHKRERAERFVFVYGHGGVRHRKGGPVVAAAAELAPELPFTVFAQTKIHKSKDFPRFPKHVEIRDEVDDPAEMYRAGDVLVAPSRVEGIGLPLLEAMASGMPVVTTHAPPMIEYQPLRAVGGSTRIECNTGMREHRATDVDPAALAFELRDLHGKHIGMRSMLDRVWAYSRRDAAHVFRPALRRALDRHS